MNIDHEYLSLKYKDESQQRFEPALHLPLPILGQLMASGSGKVTVEEAHRLCTLKSGTNLLDPQDFYPVGPVVTRRGTHFAVLDQVSHSLLHRLTERIAFGEHSPYAVGARHRLLRTS